MTSSHYFPWLLLATSIIAGAFGQLFMKVGMQTLGPLNLFFNDLFALQMTWLQLQGILWVAAGIFCYIIAMGVWIYVLGHFELSMAYPMLSIGYIVVYLGAVLWPRIGESFSLAKTGGILLIMLGVAIIAKPSTEQPSGA
ncbi:MAG: Unknown protein [uncultured Thiotrichaceae bacterium]|uniref:4-amino-4-deoxy-L-arabinose-phosphoundecaprenol flippase subunit ArnF n=1 Tax=uncultured Thiotrichaceae bacterium TaxID=298394 RepID=A0A6S6TFH8_9GAMM|nr:MAG: Unknown protein [uncultured Thiotrichaceae bacterium]